MAAMKLSGRLYQGNHLWRSAQIEQVGDDFHQTMTEALLALCRELHTPLPLWLPKNSREIARFRQTIFTPEQFDEEVAFDRFHLYFEEP